MDEVTGTPTRQQSIFLDGVSGIRPAVPASPAALERAARRKMSRAAFAYVRGGAGMERTMAANRSAFDRWRIVPRVLSGVSGRDPRVTLFGRTLPAPVLLAPVGVLEMADHEADVAVAAAAATAGVPMIFSNQASRSMEECAAVMGDAPRWFQLYWSQSTDLVLSFVERAKRIGCDALVLTLDTTMLGWRPRDLDLAYLPFLRGKGMAQYTSDPVFQRQVADDLATFARPRARVTPAAVRALLQLARVHPGRFRDNLVASLRSPRNGPGIRSAPNGPGIRSAPNGPGIRSPRNGPGIRSAPNGPGIRSARNGPGSPLAAVQRFIGTYSKPSLSWDDVAFLREQTSLPLLLKGVLHPDDARKAVDYGVDGLIVSNHGGRQVDGAIAAFTALAGVVEAAGNDLTVLMDSGVRTGADIFKALALGADAVCIGRPYAYGLAIAGRRGVSEVIANLLADFELTMALSGCRTVEEITADRLVPDVA